MYVAPLIDAPAESPGLDFDRHASILAEAALRGSPAQSTVGLFGGYGSGKTTLLRAIRRKVEAASHDSGEQVACVDFNAWRYDNEEHLFLPFLSAIWRELKSRGRTEPNQGRVMNAARGFLHGLSFSANLGLVKVGVEMDKALDLEARLSNTALERAFSGYVDVFHELESLPFLQSGGRLVLFLDDLDRCRPTRAFELLENLKVFFDLQGVVVFLALDPRVVGAYLGGKYPDSFPVTAEEYLEKVFQIPFYMPKPTTAAIAKELNDCLTKAASLSPKNAEADEWNRWMASMKEMLRTQQGYLPGNLRKAKRLLNSHQAITLAMAESSEPENERILFSLLLCKAQWPVVFRALSAMKEGASELFGSIAVDSSSALDYKELLPASVSCEEFFREIDEEECLDLVLKEILRPAAKGSIDLSVLCDLVGS